MNGTGDNKTKDLLIDGVIPTSTNEIAANLSIHPNPSTGVFNIDTQKNYNLNVVDVTGKTVMSQKLNTSSNKIDLTNYKSGMYFFRLTNENEVKVFKVIKK